MIISSTCQEWVIPIWPHIIQKPLMFYPFSLCTRCVSAPFRLPNTVTNVTTVELESGQPPYPCALHYLFRLTLLQPSVSKTPSGWWELWNYISTHTFALLTKGSCWQAHVRQIMTSDTAQRMACLRTEHAARLANDKHTHSPTYTWI